MKLSTVLKALPSFEKLNPLESESEAEVDSASAKRVVICEEGHSKGPLRRVWGLKMWA